MLPAAVTKSVSLTFAITVALLHKAKVLTAVVALTIDLRFGRRTIHIKLSYPDSPPYETKEKVLFNNFHSASFYTVVGLSRRQSFMYDKHQI